MARVISKGGHRMLVQMGIWRPDYVNMRIATRQVPIHLKPVDHPDPRYLPLPGPMLNGPGYDCNC